MQNSIDYSRYLLYNLIMERVELQTPLETGFYIGLDGLPYPVEVESASFPSADIEPEAGEVSYRIKKTINIGHYQYHLNCWLNQTAGQPFSEATIAQQAEHYQILIADMRESDSSNPEERDWIDSEYRRIDGENKDKLAA